MLIDFSPFVSGAMKMDELAQRLTVNDLRDATNASIDHMLGILRGADDAAVTFVPFDPEANDPYAAPEDQNVGWTIGHVVLHTTASAEENAAVASMLARGIPYPREPRLRYEPDWKPIKTKAQVVARLEESRRMRLGYLAAFPDQPHFDVVREVSERYKEKFGANQNALTTFIAGLYHEGNHYDQLREALRQARENTATRTAEAVRAASV